MSSMKSVVVVAKLPLRWNAPVQGIDGVAELVGTCSKLAMAKTRVSIDQLFRHVLGEAVSGFTAPTTLSNNKRFSAAACWTQRQEVSM